MLGISVTTSALSVNNIEHESFEHLATRLHLDEVFQQQLRAAVQESIDVTIEDVTRYLGMTMKSVSFDKVYATGAVVKAAAIKYLGTDDKEQINQLILKIMDQARA